ncbi:MAG: hypothetical protein NT062_33125 [Proteobacteria bacterium]|nr:hypothetical protein [Pseudomonadota bacterium]
MRCLAAGVVALVALGAACGGPQIVNERPADLTRYLPATLEAQRTKEGDPRTLHLRVYVDAAIRATPRWKDAIGDQIDYASQLLQPLIGVKLVVDDYRDWDRGPEAGDAHAALTQLTELDKLDKPEDQRVTWVIGYVAPQATATKILADLTDARPLGRHVIVRGWGEQAEVDRLATSLPELKAGARVEVLGAHRRHKQTVALLHGLATTLAAIPELDPTWIQNPTYSIKQHTFSDRNIELIDLAVTTREAGDAPVDDATVARKLLDAIEPEFGGFIPGERDLVIAQLRLVVDRAKAGQTADNIPPVAYEQWSRIRELRKRDPKQALAELDGLLAAYPANATMHQLKCDLLLAKPGVGDPTTRAACTRVSELAPGDPGPYLAVGEALARADDLLGAHATLTQAEARIGNLGVGAPEAWKRLVGIYVAMGSLTWTEEAIAKGKLAADPAAAQVAQTRARYGVVRDPKVIAPAREGAYVTAVRGALDLVYASKYGQAEKALAAGEKAWPGGPGFAAVRCDLSMRTGNFDAARAACNRALAAYPDLSWALYLGGVIDLRDPSTTAAGIAKLKKAIAVDPELGQAWRTLAKAYGRAKDHAAFDALDAAYQAKFGSPLPR